MAVNDILFFALFLGSAIPSLYLTGAWYKRLKEMPRLKALGIGFFGTTGIVVAAIPLMVIVGPPWAVAPWAFAATCVCQLIALLLGLALDFVTGCWHAPR